MEEWVYSNEEDWPLRDAICFGEPPPPNFGRMLNLKLNKLKVKYDIIKTRHKLSASFNMTTYAPTLTSIENQLYVLIVNRPLD